jgi:1-aminocyclopropane-1-carboxylate synthase
MASSSPQSPQPPAAHADATATTATATAAADPAMLAPRSQRARQPALSYFAAFIKACADLWSPNDNPEGSIVVSVAENRLSKKRVADALASAPRPPDDALGYQNFRGIDPLRASLARVMQLTLLRNNSGVPLTQEELEDDRRVMQLTLLRNNSGVPLTQEELEDDRRRLAAEMFLACGAGSVVDQIFYLLASPGDGVLIPAPYYPAFDNDLAVRDGVVPIPVFLDLEDGVDRSAAKTAAGGSDGDRQKTLSEQLDEAADAWEASRRSTNNTTSPQPRVRALLLTNPSNPLGTVLKRKQLLEMARWAHEKGIHLVSDEIYGAMVWGEEDDEEDEEARFVSAWRLLGDGTFARQLEKGVGATADPQARCEALTHVVWGLSKDFCASGLRVGVLLSRNTGIAAAWGNLSYFAGVGFPLQHSLAAVLSDEAWVESFWRDNRAALRASWEALTQALDEAGIAYVRGAKGAMFCWIDLREGLIVNADDSSDADAATKAGWEAERALWRALVRDARVVVTPGEACHAPEPGFFRVCWAWMPRDALPVAVGRIRAVLDARKNGGGDGSASA